jgi:uncharacterized protein YlbG (UPF0298 family)
MKFDEKKAEEKRKELTYIVNGILQNYNIQNKEKISSIIIDHFVDDITPPETEHFVDDITPSETKLLSKLVIGPIGIGGGKSIKPGNILLNWRKLLVGVSDTILTVAEAGAGTGTGAVAMPWLIPFAGLVVLDKILSLLTIEITERHAAVIWTIWSNRDPKDCVEGKAILKLVNKELKKYNLPKMNQKELDTILEELKKLKCIKEIEENKWCLREKVKVSYR